MMYKFVYVFCVHVWLSNCSMYLGITLCPIGMSGSLDFFQCILMVSTVLASISMLGMTLLSQRVCTAS